MTGWESIPLSHTFRDIRPIKKGMSGDEKYCIVTQNNERFLLRISDISESERKKTEYALLQKFYSLDIPMPKPVDFGICNHHTKVYTLLTWINGEEAELVVPRLSGQEQYLIGKEAGRILKKIHTLVPADTTGTWRERYFKVIDERLEAFRKEGDRFPGCETMMEYIESNRCLLDHRPQTYQHGDYHMGNLILSDSHRVSVIDWHTIDFENMGDPWYEFNRIGAENPYFASGQIDGYFDGNVPDDFWRVFAYYLSASAMTSIVWAKYFAPDCLPSVLKLNTDILKWFDNMNSPIPTWYTQSNAAIKNMPFC